MPQFLQQVTETVGPYVLRLLGPLTILVTGWLVALIVASLVREVLHRTSLDDRVARWVFGDEETRTIEVERFTAKAIYYLILVFVLVAFFQTLGLTVVTEPLNRFLQEVLQYAPRLFSAAILGLTGWLLAHLCRRLMLRILKAANVDERLSTQAALPEETSVSFTHSVAEGAYWIVLLLFLPAILNALALDALLRPIESLIQQVFGYIPNLLGAGFILLVGWFAGRIVRQITVNLLLLSGLDRFSERTGIAKALGSRNLSGVLATAAQALVVLLVALVALDNLRFDMITQPAREMITTVLKAIPSVLAALLVFAGAFLVGRLLGDLAADLLTGLGFNSLAAKLGLVGPQARELGLPARTVGYAVHLLVVVFASIEALRLIHFEAVAMLLTQLTAFTGRVLLGIGIFGAGLYFSGVAARTIVASGTPQAPLLALASRIAILVLGGAMALRNMGLANEIIDLAFGLLLGAVTLSVALAFGLGGRDIARRELEEWVQAVKSRRRSGE